MDGHKTPPVKIALQKLALLISNSCGVWTSSQAPVNIEVPTKDYYTLGIQCVQAFIKSAEWI